MALDPQETYVVLNADGGAVAVPGGARFWQLPEAELADCNDGWLISEYLFVADWPTWEMHPHADEFVYLLSGAATLYLEQADGVREMVLTGSGAVIVPRGIWHTARIAVPSRMLHVTRGAGTETKPV